MNIGVKIKICSAIAFFALSIMNMFAKSFYDALDSLLIATLLLETAILLKEKNDLSEKLKDGEKEE